MNCTLKIACDYAGQQKNLIHKFDEMYGSFRLFQLNYLNKKKKKSKAVFLVNIPVFPCVSRLLRTLQENSKIAPQQESIFSIFVLNKISCRKVEQ